MTANFGRYTRFIARRERIVSLIWVAAIVFCACIFATMYPGMLPDEEAIRGYAAMLDIPTMSAIMGKGYGAEVLNPAIVMTHECSVWFAITLIVMNIFFVNRHTRKDEELGRFEMLASLSVGRLAGSVSVLVSAFALNVAISVLSAVGLLALNIEGTTVAGAFVYSFSFGVQGFFFATVTLLTAQLFSTARGSFGIAFVVMGVCYIFRAYGDMTDSVWSYISPMGLALKSQPFYADDFTPLIVIFIEAVIVAAIALAINTKRDVGAGVFPARKGHEHASRFLLLGASTYRPFGFAWNLSKNSVLAWGATAIVLGMMYGSIIGQLDSFMKSNDMVRQMLTITEGGANSAAESFLPMLCSTNAMLITIPVINALMKLQSEERRGRMEQIYARAVPRTSIMVSFLAIAVFKAVLFTFLSAIGLYATSESTGLLSLETLMKSSFVYLPAILTLAGFAALLVGVLPKLTVLVWVPLVYAFLMLYFGALFKLPDWTLKISPFDSSPQLPIDEFTATPIVVLCVIAFVFSAIGVWRYRQRDIG